MRSEDVMTMRHRTGMRGLAAALTLAAALLATACAQQPATASSVVRASAMRFLPKDSAGLAVVEVAKMRDRDAVGRWLDDFAGQTGAAPEITRLRAALGKDLFAKVDRITLALVPGPGQAPIGSPSPAAPPVAPADPSKPQVPPTAPFPGYALIAEGRFEEAKMRDLTGGQAILTLVEVPDRPDLSLTILPGGHAALGPRAVLTAIRDNLAHPDGGLLAAPVLAILEKVDPAAQIWGAINYAPLAELAGGAPGSGGIHLPLPAAGSKGALRGVAFQGRIDKTVEFDILGVADAEAGAKQLADAARGLVAIARMGASQNRNEAWLHFLDSLRIDQSADTLRLHGTLEPDLMQSFAGRFGAAPTSSGGSPAPPGSPSAPRAPGSTASPRASAPPG